MCGIIGIVGGQPVADRLVDGLRRMEYRGYDSSGICTLHDGQLIRRRAEGKLNNLVANLAEDPAPGNVGIAHTRWATHGAPTAKNAHPHATDQLALVHNGIIENYKELRADLHEDGRALESDTDSEVVAHLVSRRVENGESPQDAVANVLPSLRGAFALAIAFRDHPDMLIGARRGSPLGPVCNAQTKWGVRQGGRRLRRGAGLQTRQKVFPRFSGSTVCPGPPAWTVQTPP